MSASREKKKRMEQVNAEVNTAPETKKGMSKTAKKFLYTIVAIVLVAAIVFLGMVSSGFFTTHTTAGIANGHKLTPAMLNFHYASAYQEMSQLLSYMVDPEKPLSEQEYMTEDFETWEDYLIDFALNSAASTYAIYDDAVANGYQLSDDAKASLESEAQMLELYASMSGYSSADAYIAAMYGPGCDVDGYIDFATISYTAQEYVNHYYTGLSVTEAEADDYYAKNPDNFDSVSFYQFNLTGDHEGHDHDADEISDEELAQLETAAAAMAEESKGSEEKFLELCLQNTPAANQEGYDATSTLVEDVAKNSLTEAIREWLSDDARQAGDTTSIYNGTNGYFVLYFVENVDHSYQLPNVRHILIGVDDNTDEAAKAEAKAEAEALLAEFKAGTASEDDFAALATENTDDTGSAANGGLYENIAPGSMVPTFDAWCFDASRQIGDTGIVESDYGYHVMYFSGFGDTYHDYLVETELINNAYNEWQTELTSDLTWELVSDKYIASR